MIFLAAIIFAAVPLTDKPYAQAVFILMGTLFFGMFVRNLIQQNLLALSSNQKKIYNKVDKIGK